MRCTISIRIFNENVLVCNCSLALTSDLFSGHCPAVFSLFIQMGGYVKQCRVIKQYLYLEWYICFFVCLFSTATILAERGINQYISKLEIFYVPYIQYLCKHNLCDKTLKE